MRPGLNLGAARPFVLVGRSVRKSVYQSACLPVARPFCIAPGLVEQSGKRPTKQRAEPSTALPSPGLTESAESGTLSKSGGAKKGTRTRKGRLEARIKQPSIRRTRLTGQQAFATSKSRWRRILPPIPPFPRLAQGQSQGRAWVGRGNGQCARAGSGQRERRPGPGPGRTRTKQGAAAQQESSMTRSDGDRALISSDVAAALPPPPPPTTTLIHGSPSQPLRDAHEPSGGHGHDDHRRPPTPTHKSTSSDDASGK